MAPELKFQPVQYLPGQSRNYTALAEQITDVSDMYVFDQALPRGIEIGPGGVIRINPAYQGNYTVLGRVEGEYKGGDLHDVMNIYWAHGNYKETWRKVLCWPQAPLKCLTFGIWNLIPTAWPCWKSEPGSAEKRKEALVYEMMRGAKAMGGNVLILVGRKDKKSTYYQGYGQAYGSGNTANIYGFGTAVETVHEAYGYKALVIRAR